jgi:hypothetical protein
VNFALVESIKRVLKAKTILGCDVSKEDNVNLFSSCILSAVAPYAMFDRKHGIRYNIIPQIQIAQSGSLVCAT